MIREIHNKLVNGDISSVGLTEKYFSKIEKEDKNLCAYLTLTKEKALKEARKIDKKIKNGEKIDLLAGIPVAIKDNICIQGEKVTAASKVLDNYIAPYDATVIKKLKEKGAIFLGKTNLDEFAMGSSTENSAYQKTKNPTDLSRVPGGSSGGSAAAVAADLAVWALGSDTGGSIRQPASFCGVVGLKPTYGRVSRHGLMAMASSLDQIGPFAKTAEDAAIILSSIAGKDKMDATSAASGGKKYEDFISGNIKNITIGVPKEYFGDELDKEIKDIAFESLEKFKKLGAKIKGIKMPNIKYALPTYYIITPSEVSSNMARYDGIRYGVSVDNKGKSLVNSGNLLETYLDTREVGLGDEVKRRTMLGTYTLSAGYYDAYYRTAVRARQVLEAAFRDVFKEVDAIVTPTTPAPAFKIGDKSDYPLEMYLQDVFTVGANIGGVPAISIPSGTVAVEANNLPLGLQLVAAKNHEQTLFTIGKDFESTER